ncbi:MAG: ABC transporter permease, partial [Acidobacteriota bacterium]
MSFGELIYRLLLKAYPRQFRRRYGEEMIEWFRAERSGLRRRGGGLRFWSRLGLDFVRSLAVEHGSALRGRRRTPGRRREPFFEGLLHDARVGFRSHARAPGVAAIITATMAIASGFVTTLFSVVQGVMLAPLPYPESERLVRVGAGMAEPRGRIYALSMPEASYLDEQNRSFDAVAVASGMRVTLRGDGEPELVRGAMVSTGFFEVLGVQPVLGRAFRDDEGMPGAEPVAVIAHDLWTQRYGSDPALVGRSIHLGSTAFTVVGIMPAQFRPPEAIGQRGVKVWLSQSHLDEAARADRINHFLGGVARLGPGISPQTAQAELTALGARYAEHYGDAESPNFGLASLHRETVGEVGAALLPLFGAVSLLLLIACANIATLLLIRAGERSREMALRSAIGAPRFRIVRQ